MTTNKQNTGLSHGADPLDGPLTAALEATPQVAIADDFAARVMSRLPAQKSLQFELPTPISIGRRVSMVAAAALLVAVMIFATQTGGANATTRILVESIFALEFAALTVWLSLRPSQSQ